MAVYGPERAFPRGEGDITYRAQHNDAKYHGQRLQPEQAGPAENSEIQTARQRAAAERNRTLQPTRPGQSYIGAEDGQRALFPGLGQQSAVSSDA